MSLKSKKYKTLPSLTRKFPHKITSILKIEYHFSLTIPSWKIQSILFQRLQRGKREKEKNSTKTHSTNKKTQRNEGVGGAELIPEYPLNLQSKWSAGRWKLITHSVAFDERGEVRSDGQFGLQRRLGERSRRGFGIL